MYHFNAALAVLVIGILGQGSASDCHSPNHPCRMLITASNASDSSVLEEAGTPLCTCPHPQECSNTWTKLGRVIAKPLSTNMIMRLMYCSRISPRTVCERNDIAVELVGDADFQGHVNNYKCRCYRRHSLFLVERNRTEDYMFHEYYKCSNHVQTCNSGDQCMTVDDITDRYPCRCPDGLRCQESENGGHCG